MGMVETAMVGGTFSEYFFVDMDLLNTVILPLLLKYMNLTLKLFFDK